jgi:hypothetical protein
MADLDEIVQKILLDGDTEVLAKFSEIGEEGYKTFKELAEAAEHGSSKMEILGVAIAGAAAAFVGLAGSVLAFVEANDETIQKTILLGEAFGATTQEVNELEAAFAALGVGTKTFEQFATRLTTTIAREWPEIAASIRTASSQAVAAQDAITSASLRIIDAQRALSFQADEADSKMASANLHVEQTFLALQAGATKALQTIRDDINSVQGAALGLEAAEQRLAELQGRPVSESDKKALELKQAQLAVEKAREAQLAAIQKQEQDRREAAAKAQQLEQAHADAQLKRNILIEEQTTARAKAELQLREAVVQREQAEERAGQQALKSIPAIRDAIRAITDGSKGAAAAIDFANVSVKNLIDGIIAAAATGDKLPPSGMKVMTELMKVLSSDTGHFIDQQQRLAVVQQLSQRGFGTVNIAASELLKALEKGPEKFKEFSNAAEKAFFTTPEAAKNVADFRDEMERLGFAIDVVNRNFAAAASPTFTKFLEEIRESLEKDGGTLHAFVDGIAAIGSAIGSLIKTVQDLAHEVDHAFHLKDGTAMQALIIAIGVAIASLAPLWAAIPIAIGLVITAIGYVKEHLDDIKKAIQEHPILFGAIVAIVTALALIFGGIPLILGIITAALVLIYENWDKIKKVANSTLDAIINHPFTKWLDSVWQKVKKIGEGIAGWLKQGGSTGASIPDTSGGGTVEASEGNAKGFATGGYISGPGTGTSDSIPARLSNGEFVVRSAAVSRFGLDFLHAVNSMSMPMFAGGGLVGAPSRLAGGGAGAPATSALNLTIDGQTFRGLKGPSSVVSDLSDFAISRQASSAGRKPSWVK